MISNWFERMLDTVADYGGDILGLRDAGEGKALPDAQVCTQLITGQGEATNIALAREILQRWQKKRAPASKNLWNSRNPAKRKPPVNLKNACRKSTKYDRKTEKISGNRLL